MVLAIAKSKFLEGNCHPKDRSRFELIYSRLVFSRGDVPVFNGEVSKRTCSFLSVHKVNFYLCLFSLTRIVKIKLMNDIMRWLAKAVLRRGYGSKATTIEKIAPLNMFSFGQISSLKKSQKTKTQKKTNKKQRPSQTKKKKKKKLSAGNRQRTTYSAIIGRRASWNFVRLQHRYFITPTNRFETSSCSSLHI